MTRRKPSVSITQPCLTLKQTVAFCLFFFHLCPSFFLSPSSTDSTDWPLHIYKWITLFVRTGVCMCKKKRKERNRVLLPPLYSFFPIILRKIRCEVHREEVAETCWGPAHPSSEFLQPGYLTLTHRKKTNVRLTAVEQLFLNFFSKVLPVCDNTNDKPTVYQKYTEYMQKGWFKKYCWSNWKPNPVFVNSPTFNSFTISML